MLIASASPACSPGTERNGAGAGGACLLSPVPGSGAAAPVREVLEGSDRRPGRRAPGAKAPPVLRAALVWMGGPLVRILDTGVRVLPQRDWEERERRIHRSLRGTSIRIDADGTLVLPCLAGKTLATLLEDPELEESVRKRAIELAVVALAEFHAQGFTHGDAMAENVMVDLEAGVAHWFDFETIHDSSRPMAWRRADDVRALLATCLLRTVPESSPRPSSSSWMSTQTKKSPGFWPRASPRYCGARSPSTSARRGCPCSISGRSTAC